MMMEWTYQELTSYVITLVPLHMFLYTCNYTCSWAHHTHVFKLLQNKSFDGDPAGVDQRILGYVLKMVHIRK